VRAKELSANAAAIEAGFRKRVVYVPDDMEFFMFNNKITSLLSDYQFGRRSIPDAVMVPPRRAPPTHKGRGMDFADFMINDVDSIELAALEMIERFGLIAVYIARDLAETAEERQRNSSQTWHDIADAIDRLWPTLTRH
jgi:hypothetical protein